MNIRQLLIILVSALMLSCDNDDYPYSEIPSVVLNEFRAKYPTATDIEFTPVGEDHEIEFEIDGIDHKAMFNSSGNILKEKQEVPWNTLPPEVRETLETKYDGNDIKDPEVIRTGEGIYYQAEIRKFLTDEKVVLDRMGKQDTGLSFWE